MKEVEGGGWSCWVRVYMVDTGQRKETKMKLEERSERREKKKEKY